MVEGCFSKFSQRHLWQFHCVVLDVLRGVACFQHKDFGGGQSSGVDSKRRRQVSAYPLQICLDTSRESNTMNIVSNQIPRTKFRRTKICEVKLKRM
jgi:hypothetical protein